MSNIRRTYTNAAAKSPIAPTSASAAATSRPASAVSTPALPSPPPSPAPVQLLCTPALLSLQATLLKSTSGLAAALVTWQGHFSVCERIISSLGNVTPRWQTLVKEEAARIRSQEEQEQRSTRNGGLQLADDASYFSEPLPSSGQKKPGNESSAALGVLASLPGVVPKLALQHERQIEVAWKLLLQTHHDFSSTNQSLSGIFDSVYSAYDLGKKTLVSPEQLTAWCVAAPGASASGSGSAHKKSSSSSSGQKSGKKSSTSSSSVASSAGSISSSTLSSGASSGREGVYGNSVWNIVHQVEEVERMVLQEYDAHLLAWSDLQSALLAAGRAGDTATSQYELVKSRDPAEAAVEQQLHLESPDLFRAWLHVDVERVLDAWTDLHSCSESHAPLLAEHLRQLHGRAPKSLTEEKTWWTAEEEEQEEDRRERRG